MHAIKEVAALPHSPHMRDVMDELQSRFLVNLPSSELRCTERLFFQLEQCHWFYEDFYADQYPQTLKHIKFQEFIRLMFCHCVLLQPFENNWETLYTEFKTYQSQVPVVGCILLNTKKDKIVLVRNWKGTSWTFPRGKVNENESDMECARREVLEECGYDVENGLSEDSFIEFKQNKQRMRMYVCNNVPEDFDFAPKTRKEISCIQWFSFQRLPKKSWCVLPFMNRLRKILQSEGRTMSNKMECTHPQRALSAPKRRPSVKDASVLQNFTVKSASTRSISTPHGRPIDRKTRGHFGTESNVRTMYDNVNQETFGSRTAKFSVEDMFHVNELLTGQQFAYDGNPHDFGKKDCPSQKKREAPRTLRVPQRAEVSANATTLQSVSPFGRFAFDAGDIMACVN